jgi:hypothetical protein
VRAGTSFLSFWSFLRNRPWVAMTPSLTVDLPGFSARADCEDFFGSPVRAA